ncbi:hypothetical protein LTR28_008610, partial [Elasticomyces elasticus]
MPSTVAIAILVSLAGASVQALPQPFVPYPYGHSNYTGTAVSFNTAVPTGAHGYNASCTTITTTTKSATVPSETTSFMPTGARGYDGSLTTITTTTTTTKSATVPRVTTTSTTVNSDAAASAAAASVASLKSLSADLHKQPTQVGRFNTLLTVDGAGKELLCGDDLNRRVVFDFNKAKAVGDGGRTSLANEDTFPIVTELGISTS